MALLESDQKWIDTIRKRLDDPSIGEREAAYYARILRVLAMPDLTLIENHPLKMLIDSIIGSGFYA